MSLFTNLFNGFASAFAPPRANPAEVAAETCCQQLGWSIDERPSPNEIWLSFKDSLIRRRNVQVGFGADGVYMGFRVFSAVSMPAKMVPHAVMGYMLERNGNLYVGWEVCIQENDIVGFAVSYFALAAGIRPELFKTICETMIQEAHEFDVRMHKAGVL